MDYNQTRITMDHYGLLSTDHYGLLDLQITMDHYGLLSTDYYGSLCITIYALQKILFADYCGLLWARA